MIKTYLKDSVFVHWKQSKFMITKWKNDTHTHTQPLNNKFNLKHGKQEMILMAGWCN